MRCLVGGVDEQHAAAEQRVVADDADDLAVQPGERDGDLTRPAGMDLEHGAVVHESPDVAAHVEGLPLGRGHQRTQIARPAGAGTPTGGVAVQFDGRYPRYRRACASASSSVATSWWPTPETVVCIRAPPISSSVVFSPVTISTIRSLPRYIDALPSTMSTMSQKAGM